MKSGVVPVNGMGGGNSDEKSNTNGKEIPINHERSQNTTGNNSPHQSHLRQHPLGHNTGFGYEPDMDMGRDMFGRMGRMHNNPTSADNYDMFFNEPSFGTWGCRRQPNTVPEEHEYFNRMPSDFGQHDYFKRLPSEFRQYFPDTFTSRRMNGRPMSQQQQQQPHPPQQTYVHTLPRDNRHPDNKAYAQENVPGKTLCDAAIQTDFTAGDSTSQTEVDGHANAASASLDNRGLRNTVDMGVKANVETERGPRSHSAPPTEQQQQQQQQQEYQAQQQQQQQHYQTHPKPRTFSDNGTETQSTATGRVRTIPIVVEGRSTPLYNAHKEPTERPMPEKQQTAPRPPRLNTNQQPDNAQMPEPDTDAGLTPQTPHTLNSISKIQSIQREVLELMGLVETFKGTRSDKTYVYLDEMLTRNLLKLDTIDTNGRDSIRMARKEAIKCIEASINVLEAKAEENAKLLAQNGATEAAENKHSPEEVNKDELAANIQSAAQKISEQLKLSNADTEAAAPATTSARTEIVANAETTNSEAIPLPPPAGLDANNTAEEQVK